MHPPKWSRGKEWMVDSASGESKARLQIIGFQIGHLSKDLRCVQACYKHVKHIADPNTHPSDAGTATALFRVESDAVQQRCHTANLTCRLLASNRHETT